MVIGLNDPQVLPSVGPNMSHWVHQQLTGCVSYSGISGLTTFDSVQTLHDSPVLTNHTLTPRLFTNNITNVQAIQTALRAGLHLLSGACNTSALADLRGKHTMVGPSSC